MGHDQTILIAVLAGVAVCGVVVLLCVICRLRQSKNVATNSNRTSGEDKQDNDALYSNIDFKRPGQDRAAGPNSVEATGGAEDDVHYSTIQPHGPTQTAGAQGDKALYTSVQPHGPTQTAGAQGDKALYTSVQPHGPTQTAGAQGDNALYASVQPKRSRQTAGTQEDDDVQYASVQFKKPGGVKGSLDQPEGELSVIYSSVHKRA
ncbi:uncharacterized protein LOC134083639 [Sardina pilchardus]|uniref:uncharacterized protein LOC134083639 n=1 Tax=Sardina pilchardus TaxID=27697 RepID=UPI002E0D98EB